MARRRRRRRRKAWWVSAAVSVGFGKQEFGAGGFSPSLFDLVAALRRSGPSPLSGLLLVPCPTLELPHPAC